MVDQTQGDHRCPFCEEWFVSFATLQDHLFGLDCEAADDMFPAAIRPSMCICSECGNVVSTAYSGLTVDEFAGEQFVRLDDDCFNCGANQWTHLEMVAPAIFPPNPPAGLVEAIKEHNEPFKGIGGEADG